ncbi:MAG: DUF262 domain-containing protein [Lepagella sp.]
MRIWKLSHGVNTFTPNELSLMRQRHQVCVHRETPGKGTSSITQGDEFFNNDREGDFFYLCYSNTSVELFGRFKEKKQKINGWVYREYELIWESEKKDKPYTKEKHWWTPNDNSTFIEVKDSDKNSFERLILKPYFGKTLEDIKGITREKKVTLHNYSLCEVFSLDLNIPEYQRIYCWPEENVIQLLKDCRNLDAEYRLGSIILQKQGKKYDIIDGQQRLVTLSLILQSLNNSDSPLLKQKIGSSEAIQYLKYNKWQIDKFIKANKKYLSCECILNNLTFNVLILNSESRELAYTFFSNENSKGVTLTDFDLLKAHHLRYVYEEPQARHLSKRWDKLLIDGAKELNNEERDYVRTLSMYIFRLRKWLNYEDWDEYEHLRVKREYEAAAIVPEIPPFGEKFYYAEPIQGGPHFFAFVERFVGQFNTFCQTPQYIAVHHNLVGETHSWMRDVIEAFLFAYYMKFGLEYLDDALMLISRIISQVRYDNQRIHLNSVLEYAKESKIAMIIDQATSPTFCLARMLATIESLADFEGEIDNKGRKVDRIRTRYQRCLMKMLEERRRDKALFIIPQNIINYV